MYPFPLFRMIVSIKGLNESWKSIFTLVSTRMRAKFGLFRSSSVLPMCQSSEFLLRSRYTRLGRLSNMLSWSFLSLFLLKFSSVKLVRLQKALLGRDGMSRSGYLNQVFSIWVNYKTLLIQLMLTIVHPH